MRGERTARVVLIAALLLLAPACNRSKALTKADPEQPACEVAHAVMQRWLDLAARGESIQSVVVDDHSETKRSFGPIAQLAPGGWIGPDGKALASSPDRAMLKQFDELDPVDALTRCSALARFLDTRHVAHGAKAVDAIVASPKDGLYPSIIVTLSFPVVSGNGTEAVVETSGVGGPEAGSGQLEYYRRDAQGHWKPAGMLHLWIS